MTPWQAALQCASLLRGVVWSDPPGSLVFTRVMVSDDEEGNFLPTSWLPDGPRKDLLPFAKVWAVAVAQDEASAAGGRTRIRLRIAVVAGGSGVAGSAGTTAQQLAVGAPTATYDTHGENQTLGTLRAAVQGQGNSQGRDVDEVLDRTLEALNLGFLVDSIHGFQGFASETPEKYPVDGVQVLARVVDVEVHNGTRTRTYHDAYLFSASAAGGGVVNYAWTAPPSRWDGPPTYIVRRGTNPGDAAPTTVTGGTGVTVAGTTAQATGLAPGVYKSTIFVQYSEVTAQDRTSPGVSCSVTAT